MRGSKTFYVTLQQETSTRLCHVATKLLITECDDDQILPRKIALAKLTMTTSSHAITVAISEADNIVPHNNQTFSLLLSTKSVNCRPQINKIEAD
jgi:hypothetical protein